MEGGTTVKRRTSLAILASLLAALVMSSAAAAAVDPVDAATLDVLVLAEGETNGLVQHIQTLGGTVKYQYQNAPVVAATIPAGTLGQVAAFAGVTSVEEDAVIELDDGMAGPNHDQQRALAAAVNVTGVKVRAAGTGTERAVEPQGYASPWFYTGASEVWPTTRGAGSIVAVVDSGVARNACLDHAVIGAPGYPDGYNATGDGIPATSSLNDSHGTWAAGAIASYCYLDYSDDPNGLIYQAQKPYLGWPIDYIPIYGQAPAAQIYPVKIFPYPGTNGSESLTLKGLDHVLTLKKTRLLDIDIVNISAGWATTWDGRTAFDRFMKELQEANILVVTITQNEGPVPNSVSTPGTSFSALSVGALDYAPSSRVYYEALGLWYMGVAGQGMVMRPTEETRVVSFSGRGPLSDGRTGPEIAALGYNALHLGADNVVYWVDGTSFAAPAVAGVAALLNSWWEAQGNETNPVVLENTLLLGANPHVVGAAWRGANDQGYGALDAPAALAHLQGGDWQLHSPNTHSPLTANVLGQPVKGKTETWTSQTLALAPGEPFNAVFEINRWTSKVTIQVAGIAVPDNSAYAIFPNALEVHVQSAKRTDFLHPVARSWYPSYGKSFEIVISDGPWTSPWGTEANQPMEPGLMKLSLLGADSNESPVSFKVRVVRENYREPPANRIANGVIKMGDEGWIPVDIPAGMTKATFDLVWGRDWSMFPTTSMQMLIYDPNMEVASRAGAVLNAPQRAVIANPQPGTWWVRFRGYTAYKPDNYDLYLTLE